MAHRGVNVLIDLDAVKKTKEDSIADLFLYIQHLCWKILLYSMPKELP